MVRLNVHILMLVVLAIVGLLVTASVALAARRRHAPRHGWRRESHRARSSSSPLAWVVVGGLGLFGLLVVAAHFLSVNRREAAVLRESQARMAVNVESSRAREQYGLRELPTPPTVQTARPKPAQPEPRTSGKETVPSQAEAVPVDPEGAHSGNSTEPLSTARSPSRPIPPAEIRDGALKSLRELEVPDPFERWKVDSELVRRRDPTLLSAQGAKPWLSTAGGSVALSTTELGPEVSVSGRRPGPGGEIVGYSTWEPDPDTAIEEARRSAVDQVRALVLIDAYGSDPGGWRNGAVLLEALRRLEPELQKRVLSSIRDEYSEGLPTEYGALHRAAVLVETNPAALQDLALRLGEGVVKVRVERAEERETILVAVASALGLALVVFLLYSFVNAGTKGYFAWPLRLLSIGTLLALYLALMVLQGWLPR